MNLAKSNVVFDPIDHTYTLGDATLSGITRLLSKHLFPNKYADIPKSILENAAKRGSKIHEECEFYDTFGAISSDSSVEVNNYEKLCKKHKIKMIESEYLVSDEMHFATMIDKVDSNANLYDIKTTSILDTESLSWQLSICAVLFEIQNPSIQVGKLYGIWLRDDKAELVEVKRIDNVHIFDLFNAEIEGVPFSNPLKQVSVSEEILLAEIKNLEESIILFEHEFDVMKQRQADYKSRLLKIMDEKGIKKWETDNLMITRKADSVRNSFDTKSFQSDHPDLYENYSKQSNVKGTILIKIKNE